VITEDWRFRMMTGANGEVTGLPVTPAARAAADAWDPAKDEAEGLQCKAYGAPSLMRLPGRAQISWQDDNTLKIDYDTGQQTRLLRFGGAEAATAEPSWPGYSVAEWEREAVPVSGVSGGGFGRAGGPRFGGPAPTGSLKVVTTRLRLATCAGTAPERQHGADRVSAIGSCRAAKRGSPWWRSPRTRRI
jgi:hypothetical protein